MAYEKYYFVGKYNVIHYILNIKITNKEVVCC